MPTKLQSFPVLFGRPLGLMLCNLKSLGEQALSLMSTRSFFHEEFVSPCLIETRQVRIICSLQFTPEAGAKRGGSELVGWRHALPNSPFLAKGLSTFCKPSRSRHRRRLPSGLTEPTGSTRLSPTTIAEMIGSTKATTTAPSSPFQGTHMWHKACSFSELDQRCEPIQRGLYRTDEIHVSPVMVVVAHPSYVFSAHAQVPLGR
jgi:hypothetical protein